MLSTGKLPLVGLPRNSVVRIIDRPDIPFAVYHGCIKHEIKQKQTYLLSN